ncbi:PDZ domain-containing protein [Marinilactibacillus sp. Marseille-P9653]|uniref:PDZ domain-containing protein n=1 Tax=Marinilactibacillus sp. Marseille-P9653 TaxID=2866583 RepID=UPI001CE46144|nr:PDZ domain-containing protein [Marinilactibacillus sp. Marseille-P9653]
MNILQSLLLAFGLFFIQPLFLVGIALVLLAKSRRVSYDRKQLRATIYKDNFEIKRFLVWGLLPGLLLSALTVFAGLPVTLDWIILYQIVTILSLGLGYRFIHPIFTFSITSLVFLALTYFGVTTDQFFSMPENWYSPLNQGLSVAYELTQVSFIIALLLLLSTVLVLQTGNMSKFIPRFLATKRGKLVAKYRMTPFWLVPLLLVIPGEGFRPFFDWWPVFSVGNQTYSFFLLPVLMGLRYTVQAQIPKEAKERLLKDFLGLSVAGMVLFALTFWLKEFAILGLLVLMIGGVFVLYRHRKREQKWSFRFGPAEQGLRVIAIRPGSPAEKMGVGIGDALLECNDRQLHTIEDLNEALFSNRAYCHLKVNRIDNEIVLSETAIYEDDPHDLGLITLEEIKLVK